MRINNQILKKIKLDDFDTYTLEMVVDNSEITVSGIDAISNQYINVFETPINVVESGETITTHGEIKSNEYFASIKNERPIQIERDFFARFSIEEFTRKLNIRKINDNEKLLEFYVNKYPDERRITFNLFIKQIKKILFYNVYNN